MTWTRLDDNWGEDPVFDDLDYETRWHYLMMIQYCSRGKRYDGVLPLRKATSCSDVPDQAAAVGRLVDIGLLKNVDGATVEVVRIKSHVPSPELLEKLEQDRARAARQRKHKAGDHGDCSPKYCKEVASRDGSRGLSRDARDSDGVGTGLAVTGSTSDDATHDPVTEAEWRHDDHQQSFPEDYSPDNAA